jgi:predicted TIM-barrel fold metal-dependent hydrolase
VNDDESVSAARHRVIDAAVHPAFAQPDSIRKYMSSEWSTNLVLPAPWRFAYANPVGDFRAEFTYGEDWPGSDRDALRRQVLDDASVDLAVLSPLGRGLVPDPEFYAAVNSALNTWLVEEWLDIDRRFLGSIRVNPEEPISAVREIERWAGHRQMVQVVVPLQSHRPYGDRTFLPVWEAAAAAGLPVTTHAEIAAGVEFWPTILGYPEQFIDYALMLSSSSILHMASLISEGVFDRLPELVFVFGDGGFDIHLPFLWRMDKDYRPFKIELAWLQSTPSDYMNRHIRFLTNSRIEGPRETGDLAEFIDIWGGERWLMFGSNYPHWDYADPSSAYATLPTVQRDAIMGGNAEQLFGRRIPSDLTNA